jgi:hypothetical protein
MDPKPISVEPSLMLDAGDGPRLSVRPDAFAEFDRQINGRLIALEAQWAAFASPRASRKPSWRGKPFKLEDSRENSVPSRFIGTLADSGLLL